MTGYGPIDILWLDGAQVLPHFFNQDIQMDRIAAMARKHQPGILLVDRMAKGPFENYQTPEGEIPPKQLNIPRETCLSMNGWGWRSEGEYKSSKKIISVLIEVVAKGGNLLLGIGPTAEGLIDNIVAERVLTIGKWLEKNGKAIYGTVATIHYNDGNVWFTCDKNQRSMYACYALDDDEKKEFLEDLGLEESGLEKLISASYSLLGLISFLTSGEDETRAWTIKEGTKAPQAAGKIHTDFERGFICAEVVSFEDLKEYGTMQACKEKGLVRQEGKEYVVQDGDIMLFRFNV